MTVRELKQLIETSGLDDGAEVFVLTGPDEDAEAYESAGASVGFGTPKPGQRKPRRYLLIEGEW